MDSNKELEIFIEIELQELHKPVALKSNDFTNTLRSSYFNTFNTRITNNHKNC
jgi:hypothetical protein